MLEFIGTFFGVIFVAISVIITSIVLTLVLIAGFYTILGYYYKLTWDPHLDVHEYVAEKLRQHRDRR